MVGFFLTNIRLLIQEILEVFLTLFSKCRKALIDISSFKTNISILTNINISIFNKY